MLIHELNKNYERLSRVFASVSRMIRVHPLAQQVFSLLDQPRRILKLSGLELYRQKDIFPLSSYI